MTEQQLLLYINSDQALQTYLFYKNRKTSFISDVTPLLGTEIDQGPYSFDHLVLSDLTSIIIGESVPNEILIATPVTRIASCLEDLRILESLGFTFKILAKVEFWESETLEGIKSKSFNTSELIKYPLLEKPKNIGFYKDKTILITGAGGSIANAMIDIFLEIEFDKLILLDHSEHAIHYLKLKIKKKITDKTEIVIASIRDKNKLRSVFERNSIHTIFHLAAYKHVGLMEADPYEAFKSNVNWYRKFI